MNKRELELICTGGVQQTVTSGRGRGEFEEKEKNHKTSRVSGEEGAMMMVKMS